jgi:hypothetical protein
MKHCGQAAILILMIAVTAGAVSRVALMNCPQITRRTNRDEFVR